ncbi:MAG TPA: hypothetical protein VHR66_18760 [Gemmataceae bacterium]|jgi:hypothetical protein|nr:hypothetical protein [Gemmataceae bacterium]
MSRSVLSVAISIIVVGTASAQCQRWYPPYPVVVIPAYPLTPAVWGTPAPKPLPPAPLPLPKRGPTISEESDPMPPAKSPEKKADPKSDTPRIPKVKIPLPGDPVDKPLPKETPKSDGPKKEPLADKAIEQFVIPSEGKGEQGPEIKVGFFNHSDREITLNVNGESVKLPREQYVTLRMPRTFTWAEKGSKAASVVVPPGADGIEIVFRK